MADIIVKNFDGYFKPYDVVKPLCNYAKYILQNEY